MSRTQIYVGIDQDTHGGMTPTGMIIRDAWMFGLLPETETCAGWSQNRVQELYDHVFHAWEPYGHMVSRLTPELRARHERIYGEAVARARVLGWAPDLEAEE